jgi:YVTN family beta-propeller protein
MRLSLLKSVTFSLAVGLSACVNDKPEIRETVPVEVGIANRVYVINEGNFGSGNSSVSLYSSDSAQVIPDYYKDLNGAPLGDVAQSMTLIDGSYYIVLNNSGSIVRCNRQLKKTAAIGGFISPRYLLQVSNRKAYVSDFKSNQISVLDLNDLTVTGAIKCSGWTEKMVMLYGKAYVTNLRSGYLYVIDAAADRITDSVYVGMNCGSAVIDKHDKIWVLGAGDGTGAGGRLSRIDPVKLQVEKFFAFSAGESPWNLGINGTNDTIYFLNGGVFRMAVTDAAIPSAPFIARGSRNYYGLGVNPDDCNIYVADALDYSQRSAIYIFSPDGTQIGFFNAGINSNSFYFE